MSPLVIWINFMHLETVNSLKWTKQQTNHNLFHPNQLSNENVYITSITFTTFNKLTTIDNVAIAIAACDLKKKIQKNLDLKNSSENLPIANRSFHIELLCGFGFLRQITTTNNYTRFYSIEFYYIPTNSANNRQSSTNSQIAKFGPWVRCDV